VTSRAASLLVAGGGVALAVVLDLALGRSSEPAAAVTFFGRFHPLVVHLPIGVTLLVAVLEALALSPRLRRAIDPALSAILPLALLSTLAAFALGLMLAQSGGHPIGLLRLHERLALGTVIGTAGTLVAWSMYRGRRVSRQVYRVAVLLTVSLLSIGAHFGGSMTHGGSYLFEYAPSFVRSRLAAGSDAAKVDAAPVAPGRVSEPRVFGDVVLPILKQRCASCHGQEKAKGGLRADSLKALLKGGKGGAAIDVGHSERSRLVQRILRPASEDGHMPPEDKPQMTPEELELIRFWIDSGASTETKVRDLIVPEAARGLLVRAAGGAVDVAPVEAAPAARATEPPPTTAKEGAAVPEAIATLVPSRAGLTFSGDVAPILANKCGRCHGENKQKGRLRTDSMAALVAGGKSGPAIVMNDPARGALLARVHLPIADDDHMPPRDEPQLDARELRIISSWIARGAAEPRAAGPHAAGATESAPRPPSPSPRPSLDAATTAPVPITQPVRLFTDVVQPILARRCGECHSGQNPAGDLSVWDRDALFATSRVVPGDPSASPLFRRMTSPLGDDDHMPPNKKEQPSQTEIDAVGMWIARGAGDGLVIDASEVPPQLIDRAHAQSAESARSPTSEVTTPGGATHGDPNAAAADMVVTGAPRSGCVGCGVARDDEHAAHAAGLGILLLGILAMRRGRA
jgi:uncharacterized membrane protein